VDGVLATAAIRNRYNPRTGEFVVKHNDGPATLALTAVINTPHTRITSVAFDIPIYTFLPPVLPATIPNTGTARRFTGETLLGSITRADLPARSLTDTDVYYPRVTTTTVQGGVPTTTAQYPTSLRVVTEQSYDVNAVLGTDGAKNVIIANMPAFAALMSDPAGFVLPPGTYQNTLRGLKDLTDGQVANYELTNIILLDETLPNRTNRIVFQELQPNGQQVSFAYDIANTTEGEQKMRDLITFFAVEPLLKY
jgi:hypothetical protein